jgi:hypothetical protein
VISAEAQSISTSTPRYSRLVAALTGCSVFWPVALKQLELTELLGQL